MKTTMKYLILSALLSSAVVLTQGQDDCASALNIGPGVHQVIAVDGSEIPMPICAANGIGADHGEWYTYTATEDLTVTVTTDIELNSGGDTRFHVYTGTCGSLVCHSGDDDSGDGLLSVANFQVTAGTTYYIAWDDKWSDAGFYFELIEDEPVEGIITFTSVNVGLQGSGYAAVDMNDDNLDDLVGVSGNTVNILHQTNVGTLQSTLITTPDPAYSPSWSLAAGDLDGNGMTDLLYASGSGVSFMWANEDGTAFTESHGNEYVFSQRSNMVDINNDGHLDAYVCHDVQPNVYYINDGNGNLTFFQGGLGDTPQGGNYGSVWIDYDNDYDIDLFIAKCGADPWNQLHRNDGGGVFTEVTVETGLESNVQTWSSAWGDYDNDGDMDLLVGASSTSNGGHQLMRNDNGVFVNVTAGSGFDTASGTGIENCTQDFNNDGFIDVYGVGNTMMLNNGDMTFTEVDAPFSTGPIGDLNNDGFLDVLNGSTLYYNDGNENNYLRVHLLGVESNRDGIGARVEVTSALGTQIRDIRAGEGFRYMSSLTAHFGIANDTEVEQVVIHWPSGTMDVVYNPNINTTLLVEEGSSATSVEELEDENIQIFPLPAIDHLNIVSESVITDPSVTITDIKGSIALRTVIEGGRVDISSLESGQYSMRLIIEGRTIEKKFIKE